MDPHHVLAQRSVGGLLHGSLALSARPDAPVLAPRPSRRARLRRLLLGWRSRPTHGRATGDHLSRPGHRLPLGS